MSVIIEKGQRLRADIIKHLYYKKALSLTDLSKLTKKSLPLVTSVVNGLITEGYIIEQGLAPSTGGRRPSIYLLNPDHHKYIVAVAMDQLITRLTIYDLSRKVILPIQYLDLHMSDSFEDVDTLASFISDSIAKSKIDVLILLALESVCRDSLMRNWGLTPHFYPSKMAKHFRITFPEKLIYLYR